MNTTEIKKELYKQKPIANKVRLKQQEGLPEEMRGFDIYLATIIVNGVGVVIEFRIPFTDRGDATFGDREPAQLLIRWLHEKEVTNG